MSDYARESILLVLIMGVFPIVAGLAYAIYDDRKMTRKYYERHNHPSMRKYRVEE